MFVCVSSYCTCFIFNSPSISHIQYSLINIADTFMCFNIYRCGRIQNDLKCSTKKKWHLSLSSREDSHVPTYNYSTAALSIHLTHHNALHCIPLTLFRRLLLNQLFSSSALSLCHTQTQTHTHTLTIPLSNL
jgi:hypothetical protein